MTATAPIVGASGTQSTNAANLAAGQQNLSTAYSDFLTLLTTQLKNQDPTSPMDTKDFTQQLVSMTGVQQQLLTNELLQQLVTSNAGSVSSGVDLIGKQVTATSANAVLSGGQAGWTYSLPSAAANATASVTDAAGNVVWSGPAGGLSAGKNSFVWNGRTMSGSKLPDGGLYTLAITAQDAAGQPVAATLSTTGVASGVTVAGGTTQVTVNGVAVPVSAITNVGAGP